MMMIVMMMIMMMMMVMMMIMMIMIMVMTMGGTWLFKVTYPLQNLESQIQQFSTS